MKIALKDLRPNPFRDLAQYPIHREKIEGLKASIRGTGFWDNFLVRKAKDSEHYEVAYGHHRLEALKELIREKMLEADFHVDVPVRTLDDAAMIRIMANENSAEYRVTAEVVDDTVRVAREYIHRQTKTPLSEITASDVAQFLGGSWNESKVGVSLQRLGLFDRGTLRREQLKGLSHTAARAVQREAGRVEKTMLRDEMARLEADDEDPAEESRKRVRAQVQKAANHVAQVVAEHLRSGGTAGDVPEKSIGAQIETLPDDDEDRSLSTIDAAAQNVHAREFQRRVEMLMKYQQYMADESRDALKARLRELGAWCKQKMEELGKQKSGSKPAA
jgi:hypothetical protein